MTPTNPTVLTPLPVVAPPAAAAPTQKLFLPPLMNGISTGGPFFANPIG